MELPTPLLPASPAPGDVTEPSNRIPILEAMASSLPKLKELNYAHWKLALSDAIQTAELWGYVDGSAVRPPAVNIDEYKRYIRESAAVRSAIAESLEPGAHKCLEGALTSREAWLALENHYQSGGDAYLVSVEQQLAELKLVEGGDVIKHVANFCRLRRLLDGTRFALDDQASIDMMYRSLPPSSRQWTLAREKAEIEDFESLCSCLRNHYRNVNQQLSVLDISVATENPTVDNSSWGVPDDIKAFDLTGNRNPLLEDRAKVTCRDCLLKDHQAATPECPQFVWRRELWGEPAEDANIGEQQSVDLTPHIGLAPITQTTASSDTIHIKSGNVRSFYEFSETVKVNWDFGALGLKERLLDQLYARGFKTPTEIQQCAITPIVDGRSVLAQAQPGSGKTIALAVSVIQSVDAGLLETQALVLTPTEQLALKFESTIAAFGNGVSVRCHACTGVASRGVTFDKLTVNRSQHIVSGTPDRVLSLIRRGILRTGNIKMFVVDGLDEFIGEGFKNDIPDIYHSLLQPTQFVVLHTTVPDGSLGNIMELAVDPIRISVKRDEPVHIPENTKHFSLSAEGNDKRQILKRLIQRPNFRQVVVFCNTSSLVETLRSYVGGIAVLVHEQMGQNQRESAMQQSVDSTRSNVYKLITTDTLTRGFYPQQTSIVINYDLPDTPEKYVNRLGYSSGFGSKDLVISFTTTSDDDHIIQNIEQRYGIQIPRVPLSELGI